MKILSLRGGGIKGRAPAQFLANLETKLGPLHEVFDLITGTSTGGIMAIGLGLGLTAASLAGFYEQDGPVIFKRRLAHYFGLLKSRYDGDVLRGRLDDRYGMSLMRQCKTRVMVTLSDVGTRHARFVKSWKDGFVVCADAGRGTSAAPDYFDPATITPTGNFEGGTFCDGGLFANNPAVFALVEAINLVQTRAVNLTGVPVDVVNATLKGVKLVDLGCPEPATSPVAQVGAGALRFLLSAVSDVLEIGMDASATACQTLLGANYLELVPELSGTVDDGKAITLYAANQDMADAGAPNLAALKLSGEALWLRRGQAAVDFLK